MNWYVVYTQPHKEQVALRNLAKQGFDAYLPRYQKQCRHARRIYTVMTPLFPRYLFVRLDPETQRWRSINGTIGVSYLLSEGPDPIAIPNDVVDAIHGREREGIVQIAPPEFVKGQKLCITDGPFAELEGLFECVDDEQRVVLLLEFMGRVVRTRLPGHAVTAA
ncbi:MAG: transcriptional activator RfaH [Rhodospirillales bacterium CG15_BIG_FIL_POST_REV_8_21_14_020_66_15]|nr:MAG: transcriptional activator RfaH [Rhodospirillales bacterium CG15_BIG_FIL_POST_REV_8_21_14_020_66_15]